jgi:hypothetical protein
VSTATRGAAVALAAAVLALLAACSSGNQRSAANFCHTYEKDKARLIKQYGNAGSDPNDPLGGFISAFGMMGGAADMFSDLAKVAPPEIESATEHIRDEMNAQPNVGNPLDPGSVLGALGTSLGMGLMATDAWQQVGNYVTNVCHD